MLDTLNRLRAQGYEDFDISEVEAHAMLGDTALALDLLETELDNDWMNLWWYAFDGPNLADLSAEPRFVAMYERVRQNMHALRDGLEPRFTEIPDDE